jgi:ABC-type Fe3+ transport system permease subunit
LIILQSFALFGAPAVIGMPAKIYTIATKIYSFFYFPPRFEMAAAVATPMILMTAILHRPKNLPRKKTVRHHGRDPDLSPDR